MHFDFLIAFWFIINCGNIVSFGTLVQLALNFFLYLFFGTTIFGKPMDVTITILFCPWLCAPLNDGWMIVNLWTCQAIHPFSFLFDWWTWLYDYVTDGYKLCILFSYAFLYTGLWGSNEWLCWEGWAETFMDREEKSNEIHLSRDAWSASCRRTGLYWLNYRLKTWGEWKSGDFFLATKFWK